MRGGVDPAGEAADHGQTRIGELVGKLLRALRAVVAGAARADDRDGVLIALRQLAPDVEHDRRRMDFAQLARIDGRLRGDDLGAEVADALQLGRQVDCAFPIRDLLGDVVPDAVDRPQLAPLRRQDPLRRFEDLEQLAQTHRPHARDHVERDAGLGAVHGMQPKFRGFSLGAMRAARSERNVVVVRLAGGRVFRRCRTASAAARAGARCFFAFVRTTVTTGAAR